MIILNKEISNGVVYNAKGDLISIGLQAITSYAFTGLANASITVNTSGTITGNTNNGPAFTPVDFVELVGSGTDPVTGLPTTSWDSSWYNIGWVADPGNSTGAAPSTSQAIGTGLTGNTFSSSQTFQCSSGPGVVTTGQWTVTITSKYDAGNSITFTVNVDTEAEF